MDWKSQIKEINFDRIPIELQQSQHFIYPRKKNPLQSQYIAPLEIKDVDAHEKPIVKRHWKSEFNL